MFFLLFFSIGIILVAYLPELPSVFTAFLLFISILLLFVFCRKKYLFIGYPLVFTVGILYGVVSGFSLLNNQLSNEFTERNLIVDGRVIDLPQANERRQLFSFQVIHAYLMDSTEISIKKFPHKLILSSYSDLRVKTGERWRLTLKLKTPRGFVNPGGFDYQASLLRRGIGATGYIRQGSNKFGDNKLLEKQSAFSFDVLRYHIQQWLIAKNESKEKGLLIALLVGDTSLVDKEHWSEMLKTGTNHLISISGLHIGFFAIIGFFIGNLLGRFVQVFWHKCPSMIVGYIFSIVLALFYSLIAGFNIPTIRTLIMLSAVQLALLWRRNFRARDTLVMALTLVLLYDPLAVYDIGFWLSFCAVGMLVFCFTGRIAVTPAPMLKVMRSGAMPLEKIYRQHFIIFMKSQWVMFVGLLIPLSILVHTSSLIAPPANFIAIPVITFFVVPCLMLSALCHFTFGYGEEFFLYGAQKGILWVHEWLHYLLTLSDGKANPLINFNIWSLYLAFLGILLILLPRGLGNKWIGVCGLTIAFFIPLKPVPNLFMLVFDVGQGTAVLIRTPNHQLIYDTGPLYTENFDAGSGIIAPYLQGQGLRHVDSIVVSHNDQDHSGGLSGVLATISADHLLLGEPEKYHRTINDPPIETCHTKTPWQWDGVNFSFIHWDISPSAKANNHSCVLLIEYGEHKILLTGDIEKDVEKLLVAQHSLNPVDLLLAPHHGSHTSSTPEFIAQVQPKYVIYSAGYHNQHGHPHKDIQERYKAVGAIPLNTAYDGALEFTWWRDEQAVLSSYRQSAQRYWFDGRHE